jgi:4-hydroxybenzoate polyprenyltransferase
MMSTRTTTSFVINALIIFSTIHAQDFCDEIGDRLMGRQTIPMVWAKGSRVWIFVALTAWSVGLSWACDLAPHFSVPFCALAVFIGLRFLRKRTADVDKRSYYYYNVRVLLIRAQVMQGGNALIVPCSPQIWLTAAQVVHIPTVAEAIARSPAST